MKKKRKKKTYGSYLLRHLGIQAILWLLLSYVFLQVAYYVIFTKIEQKSAVNFYEAMETIQYLMKDHQLMDERVEVMEALKVMSDTGDYYISHSSNPVIRNYGELLGLQLGMAEWFLFWSDASSDGRNNVYLPGVGKGMGFLLDGETDEILFDSQWKEDVQYLCLQNLGERLDANSVTGYATALNTFYCPKSKLDPLVKELSEVSTKWYERLRETGAYTTEKRLVWRMEEFYYREDEYYPAKVSLYFVDIRDYRTAREEQRYPDELMETKEIVRDDHKDWKIYKMDPQKERLSDGGINGYGNGFSDLYEKWTPDETFRKKAYEAILANQEKRGGYTHMTSDIGKSWSEGNHFFNFLNGEMIFVRTAYFQDVTGHSYRACTYQSVSELFEMNLMTIVGCTFVLALFLSALAFLTSYIAYLKQRNIFITEEYREMLMDSMAHDLKSPLMAVSGYADNLREHVSDEKRDHYAEQIQKSVGYMNDIVMKNLEILKFSKEKQRVVRRRVNVRMLFEEVFSRYQGEISKRALKVSLMGEMMAWGDEALLQKVAENLVTNAVRYTKDGGEISVTFSSHRLLMKNETEIPYEGKLKRLWEPFARGEDSRTGKGTGLGLAIVANVLDRHDWKYRLSYDKETKLFQCEIKIPYGILF